MLFQGGVEVCGENVRSTLECVRLDAAFANSNSLASPGAIARWRSTKLGTILVLFQGGVEPHAGSKTSPLMHPYAGLVGAEFGSSTR